MNAFVKRTRLSVTAVLVLALLVSVPLARHTMKRIDQHAATALVSLLAKTPPATAGPTPKAKIVLKATKPNRIVVVSLHAARTYAKEKFSMTANVHVALATTATSTKVFGETVTFVTHDHAIARFYPSVGSNTTTHQGGTTYIDTPAAAKVTSLHRTYRLTGRLHTTVKSNGAVSVQVLDVKRV